MPFEKGLLLDRISNWNKSTLKSKRILWARELGQISGPGVIVVHNVKVGVPIVGESEAHEGDLFLDHGIDCCHDDGDVPQQIATQKFATPKKEESNRRTRLHLNQYELHFIKCFEFVRFVRIFLKVNQID